LRDPVNLNYLHHTNNKILYSASIFGLYTLQSGFAATTTNAVVVLLDYLYKND